MTEEAIRNLLNTIYSKGQLLSKATGGDFHVSDALVNDIKEYGSEGIFQLIESAGEGLRGISIEGNDVKFTGFPGNRRSPESQGLCDARRSDHKDLPDK